MEVLVAVAVDVDVLTLGASRSTGVGRSGASHRSSSTEQRGILECQVVCAVK